ncbi:MAG: peptidoglycan DD-metalloendopeptidase family protein [Clostridia bacterium]|nr:peptidoglycan DD-metalloendopeptidase family protein [Clostridia bacterium]
MKRKAFDTHHKERKYSTFMYIPHNGGATKTIRVTSPIIKLSSLFMMFIVIISLLVVGLTYFINESRDLSSKLSEVVNEQQMQVSVLNSYIQRQSYLIENKSDELMSIEGLQNSIGMALMNLSIKLENVTTTYVDTYAESSGTAPLSYTQVEAFLKDAQDLANTLSKVEQLSATSDSQLLSFNLLKNELKKYLDKIPSVWPTESTAINSPFGTRFHPILSVYKTHTGVDLGGTKGDDIYASGEGTVVFSGYNGGYGYMIKIDHGEGIETIYGHCSKLLVNVGDYVEKGQLIGLVGSTGLSTGPHLHFEVRIDNVPVNPLAFIGE